MNKEKKLTLLLTLLGWVLAFGIALLVLYPIVGTLHAFLMICFVTIFRWVFFMPYAVWVKSVRLKLLLIFVALPLIFFTATHLATFQAYIDNEGIDGMFCATCLRQPLAYGDGQPLFEYIRNQYLFFSIGTSNHFTNFQILWTDHRPHLNDQL